jgi:PAS domain S-box-containing protein
MMILAIKQRKILALLMFLVITPLLLLAYFNLERAIDDYQFSKRELLGARLHSAVYQVLLDIEKLQSLHAQADKRVHARNVMTLQMKQLNNHLLQVDNTFKNADILTLKPVWLVLKKSIQSEFLTPAQAFSKSSSAQAVCIQKIQNFLGKISVQSNMVLDPELVSYRTMLIMVENIPQSTSLLQYWKKRFEEARRLEKSDQENKLSFLIALDQLQKLNQQYAQLSQAIAPRSLSAQAKNNQSFSPLNQHLSTYQKLANAGVTAIDATKFRQETDETIEALHRAYLAHAKQFNTLISNRMQEISHHLLVLFGLILLVGLACVSFVVLAHRNHQRQAEANLHLKATFNTVMDALIVISEKGEIVTVNPATSKIFGYEAIEMIGKNIRMLMPNPYRDEHDDYLRKYRETGESKIIGSSREVLAKKKDGSEFPINLSISETKINGVKMFVGSIQDLTARKASENAILEQKQQMVELIQNQSVATFLIDTDRRVLHWNKACENLTGVSADEMIGTQNVWKAFYETERPCLAELVLDGNLEASNAAYSILKPSTLVEDGWHAESWFENLGGQRRYLIFDAAPVHDSQGKVIEVVETLQDITEMKQAEQALAFETKIAQRALQSLEAQKYALDQHAIVTRKDKNGNITYANQKICDISGYTQAELMGKTMDILDAGVHPQTYFDEMRETINQGKVWNGEVCYRNIEGGLFWVNNTVVPILGEDGKPEEFIAIKTDITERKNMETELRQAYANLEEFTAVASHDLKSPIRGIADLVEWIDEDLGENVQEEVRKNIDRVKLRVARMEHLIEDLLQYSRAGKKFAEISPVDPQALVQETIELISPPEGFKVTVTGTARKFNTAVTPLKTTLRNLISNAIKHHDQSSGNIEINLSSSKGYCVFKVQDDGPGIPETARERVFKLFQTLSKSKDSTGLGLAVSKRMVEAHEGRIEIEPNQTERGTTFVVRWPISTKLKKAA